MGIFIFIILFAGLGILTTLYLYQTWYRRQTLKKLGSSQLLKSLVISQRNSCWVFVILAVIWIFGCAALLPIFFSVTPDSVKQLEKQSVEREIVFVLDQAMGNQQHWQYSKQLISKFIDSCHNGEKVALYGTVQEKLVSIIPLTLDYFSLELALQNLKNESMHMNKGQDKLVKQIYDEQQRLKIPFVIFTSGSDRSQFLSLNLQKSMLSTDCHPGVIVDLEEGLAQEITSKKIIICHQILGDSTLQDLMQQILSYPPFKEKANLMISSYFQYPAISLSQYSFIACAAFFSLFASLYYIRLSS
ncbi:MAG: hypothetical protein K0S74_682 [Chlamydiales bacterium]|jgi:hypothetical protein|nr:hypothetical protein [Chlamydiales bacterium]